MTNRSDTGEGANHFLTFSKHTVMKTQQKIEKKGYKVTYNLGHRNGEQVFVSVTATKGNSKITEKNITALYNSVK